MAQGDLVVANATGLSFRQDLNAQLLALGTLQSGPSAPSTTYAYMLWADTTAGQLKIRNAANDGWIVLQGLDGSLSMQDGSAATPGLAFASDTNTGIFRPGADQFGVATGGVENVEFGTSEVVFNDGGADIDFRIEGDTEPNLFKIDAGTDQVQVKNLNGGPLAGTRNRIINGDMRIDQRNAGAAVTINSTANTYCIDRWFASGESTDGVFTVDQTTDAPTGFTNSTRITVTTADASIGSTQLYLFRQAIEGNNVYDLGLGTANAKTFTFSFWVRSSLTGTFGGALNNSANDRNYPFTYSISAANTWEYKTVTVAGDTTGTWLTDTGRGLTLTFQIGAGSSRVAAAGSWTGTSSIYGATGATNIIGTLNATWDITGVQLEAGTVATLFERTDYSESLRRCQRYYVIYRGGAGTFDYAPIGVGNASGSTTASIYIPTPVTLRASPTLSFSGTVSVTDGVVGVNVTSVGTQYMSSSSGVWAGINTNSGMAAGRGAFMYTQNATTNFFALSSEL